MKRKVVKHGNSTLTVSLPSKWAKKHNLKAGDEIEFEEKREGLLVKTAYGKSEPLSITVNVSGPWRLLRKYIGNLYRKGYDEMRLEFDDPKLIKEIEKLVVGFMGLEITDQGSKYCVIRNVANVKEDEFDNMLNRMFLLTLTMGNDLIDGIKKNNLDELSNISILEKTHNKLFNFCLRVINKPDFQRSVYFIGKLIIRLEDAGDRYRDIAEYIVENKGLKISKETLLLLEEANSKLRKVYELYSKFDMDKALHIENKKEQLTKEAFALLEKVPKKEIRIAHLIADLINDIYEAESPIFGLHL